MSGGTAGVENPFPPENKEGCKQKLSLGHCYETGVSVGVNIAFSLLLNTILFHLPVKYIKRNFTYK